MTNQAAQTMPGLHGLSDAADYLARNPSDEYAQRRFRERMEQVRAALSQTAGVPEPLPMDTAPRDGTMVRLLVNFTDHATEDTAGPAWTIGAYPSDDESGGWQFAGWCWTHDHFTEGEGTPIGWLPMLAAAPAASGGDEPDPLVIAKELATSIWSAHYREDSPNWEPFDNLAYVLSQISNMVSGMTRIIEPPSAASVGGVHPDALPDGTLSKSTAKRLAGASVSERARGYHQHDAIEFAVRDLGYSPADAARITAAIEQALTQQRGHGTTGSMEQAEKATFVPCDCGCGRNCCAMCGNDVGFLTPQPSADAVRELAATWRKRAERKRFVGLKNEALLDEAHADELESLLSGGSHA